MHTLLFWLLLAAFYSPFVMEWADPAVFVVSEFDYLLPVPEHRRYTVRPHGPAVFPLVNMSV